MNRRFWSAALLQFMGTVGSGIFVLPYLFAQSGFLFAVCGLIFLTLVTAALNFFYVEIVLATPGDHQLAGYAGLYLGARFRSLAVLNLLLLSFGAVLAYYLLFVRFVLVLFPAVSSSWITLIFLAALALFFNYRFILDRKYFFFVPVLMVLIPLVLFFFSLVTPVSPLSFNVPPNFSFFGAAIFALSGFTIIPEVREMFGVTLPTRRRLLGAVLAGLFIAAVVYLIYAFSVNVLSGTGLSVDSVTGLSASFPLLAKIIALFGAVVTLRASFGFLLILRELFYRDLKISRPLSETLPMAFPLLAVILHSASVLTVISLTGHITIFISALLICFIRLRLPHAFFHQFLAMLIFITLTLGLFVNLY